DNIDVRYEDYYSGIFIDVVLKDLQARARDFDLTGGLIDLANVEIDGLLADLSIREGSAPETDDNGTEDEPETPLRLLAGTIEINASEVRFRDDNSGSEINFDLGSLRVEDPHVDIEGPGIAVDAFHLERSFIAYHQLAPKDTVDAVSATNDPQSKPGTWSFELASLSLKDN